MKLVPITVTTLHSIVESFGIYEKDHIIDVFSLETSSFVVDETKYSRVPCTFQYPSSSHYLSSPSPHCSLT
jgi:hypothetical protein